jgi:hypothetical protein
MFASPQLAELQRDKARAVARSEMIRTDLELQAATIAPAIGATDRMVRIARTALAIRRFFKG